MTTITAEAAAVVVVTRITVHTTRHSTTRHRSSRTINTSTHRSTSSSLRSTITVRPHHHLMRLHRLPRRIPSHHTSSSMHRPRMVVQRRRSTEIITPVTHNPHPLSSSKPNRRSHNSQVITTRVAVAVAVAVVITRAIHPVITVMRCSKPVRRRARPVRPIRLKRRLRFKPQIIRC